MTTGLLQNFCITNPEYFDWSLIIQPIKNSLYYVKNQDDMVNLQVKAKNMDEINHQFDLIDYFLHFLENHTFEQISYHLEKTSATQDIHQVFIRLQK